MITRKVYSDYKEGNTITLSLHWLKGRKHNILSLQWLQGKKHNCTEFTVITRKETQSHWVLQWLQGRKHNHIEFTVITRKITKLHRVYRKLTNLQSLQRLQGRKHIHIEFTVITRKETQLHWVYSNNTTKVTKNDSEFTVNTLICLIDGDLHFTIFLI